MNEVCSQLQHFIVVQQCAKSSVSSELPSGAFITRVWKH